MSMARQNSATDINTLEVEPAPKHTSLIEGDDPPSFPAPKVDTLAVDSLATEPPWSEAEALNLQAEATEWLRK